MPAGLNAELLASRESDVLPFIRYHNAALRSNHLLLPLAIIAIRLLAEAQHHLICTVLLNPQRKTA